MKTEHIREWFLNSKFAPGVYAPFFETGVSKGSPMTQELRNPKEYLQSRVQGLQTHKESGGQLGSGDTYTVVFWGLGPKCSKTTPLHCSQDTAKVKQTSAGCTLASPCSFNIKPSMEVSSVILLLLASGDNVSIHAQPVL